VRGMKYVLLGAFVGSALGSYYAPEILRRLRW
jgi:hypothetical protein